MNKSCFSVCAIFIFCLGCWTESFANTVSLDTSFNGIGYKTDVGAQLPVSTFGGATALQADGKMIIAGRTASNDVPNSFVVARVNPDGSPDVSFGTNGVKSIPGFAAPNISRILLQNDGRILLAGSAGGPGGNVDFLVIRLLQNGNLDTAFNNLGWAQIGSGTNRSDECDAIALQTDGKIVLAGRSVLLFQPSLDYDYSVARINADGTIDQSFDGDGIATFGTTDKNEEAHAVTVTADGKTVVGGGQQIGGSYRFMLARFNANGTIDPTFGSGGSSVVPSSFGNQVVYSMQIQPSGKIVAAGSGLYARIDANGALDATFGQSGKTETFLEVNDLKQTANGKLLATGRFGANLGIQRIMANGAFDTNFRGPEGVNYQMPGSSCFGISVAEQQDHKVVVGGGCAPNSGGVSIALFRFAETPTSRFLDFSGDGVTDLSLFRPADGRWSLSSVGYFTFGVSIDKLVPADFTNDGRTDIAVFRPSESTWYVLRSDNNTYFSYSFGTSGDQPLAGDFDGDQYADTAVFRPSNGLWIVMKSTGGVLFESFGMVGDRPVPADYDGDGKIDIAVFRPSDGVWWILRSGDGGFSATAFGTASDRPVAGDYTGDGKADLAFFRPQTGEWFIRRSEDGSYYSLPFGLPDDLPVPGDYNGDGKFDLSVYRASSTEWHFLINGNSYSRLVFGSPGDLPVGNLVVQ